MNPYVKGFLIILASAMGAGAAVASTTHDIWTIALAVIANVSTTTIALVMQSPIPRKEWTQEERAAVLPTPSPQPKGSP